MQRNQFVLYHNTFSAEVQRGAIRTCFYTSSSSRRRTLKGSRPFLRLRLVVGYPANPQCMFLFFYYIFLMLELIVLLY